MPIEKLEPPFWGYDNIGNPYPSRWTLHWFPPAAEHNDHLHAACKFFKRPARRVLRCLVPGGWVARIVRDRGAARSIAVLNDGTEIKVCEACYQKHAKYERAHIDALMG